MQITAEKKYPQWARLSLFNLFIVSLVGVLLRYKIVFPLPLVDQKNLLHGHSHFAFSGWVSSAIFTLFISVLLGEKGNKKIYQYLFWALQLTSYGMLFSFPFQGYAGVSITFSTLSILVSYVFAWQCNKDLAGNPKWVKAFVRAALFCFVISSLGAFFLAYLMASKNVTQELYIGSVYFFLHFQYNGWFVFAILALLLKKLYKTPVILPENKTRLFFWLIFIASFPTYFLTTLWMRIPVWMYISGIGGAFIQLFATIIFAGILSKQQNFFKSQLLPVVKILWLLSFLAFSIKVLLQLFSVIPFLSKFAFGYRSIVIGYLHLSFLGVTTLFLLGYLLQEKLLLLNKIAKAGVMLFVSGVIINQLLLMTQGFAAILFISLGWANYALLIAAVIMCTGLLFFLLKQVEIKQAL